MFNFIADQIAYFSIKAKGNNGIIIEYSQVFLILPRVPANNTKLVLSKIAGFCGYRTQPPTFAPVENGRESGWMLGSMRDRRTRANVGAGLWPTGPCDFGLNPLDFDAMPTLFASAEGIDNRLFKKICGFQPVPVMHQDCDTRPIPAF